MGYIGQKAARSILHAPRTAVSHGRPLNVSVTVRLGELGSNEWTALRDTRGIVSTWFQAWSRRSTVRGSHPANGVPTHFGVIEDQGSGPHLHWCLHLKRSNRGRFEEALERRIRRQFGIANVPAGVIHIKEAYNPEGLKKYLLKTADPYYCKFCNIESKPNTGMLHGRQAFTSANLWPRHWRPLRDAYKASLRSRAA